MNDLYLFRSSLRDLTRPKRLIIAVILIAVPVVIALILRNVMTNRLRGDIYDPDVVYNGLAAFVVFGFLLVILAVVFGTGALSQEIEQKTIVYLLTRPLPRWRLLLTKFLAAITVTTITVWIAAVALAVAVYGFGGAEKRHLLLNRGDLLDLKAVEKRLTEGSDPAARYLQERMSMELQGLLKASSMMGQAGGLDALRGNLPNGSVPGAPGPFGGMPGMGSGQPGRRGGRAGMLNDIMGSLNEGRLQRQIVQEMNSWIASGQPLYDREAFAGVNLSEETRRLAEQPPDGAALMRLNRALLESVFPNELRRSLSVTGILLQDFKVLFLGAFAYGALFLLLATLISKPLMGGLTFAFGWESWAPNLPGSFQKISLMSYLRVLAPHPEPEVKEAGLGQLFQMFNPDTISPALAWTVLLSVIVVALGAALFLFSTREYVPREDVV